MNINFYSYFIIVQKLFKNFSNTDFNFLIKRIIFEILTKCIKGNLLFYDQLTNYIAKKTINKIKLHNNWG